jgi:hypothetical protein
MIGREVEREKKEVEENWKREREVCSQFIWLPQRYKIYS